MKQFLVSQLILIAIILPSDSLGRNWTDLKGRSLEGELLSCDEKQITIKRLSDQKEFSIKRSTLSASDNKYLDGIPFFRGCFPGMTYKSIEDLTAKEPLKFSTYKPYKRSVKGMLFLQPDYSLIQRSPEHKNYCRVAVSEGETVYEWYKIAIEMYDGKAVNVSFGTPPRVTNQVNQWIFPWASTMYSLLTEKHGKPDTLYKDPSQLSILDARSGYVTYIAEWIKGDYQITLGIGKSDYKYTADVSYTYLPLLKKQKANEAEVKGNF